MFYSDEPFPPLLPREEFEGPRNYEATLPYVRLPSSPRNLRAAKEIADGKSAEPVATVTPRGMKMRRKWHFPSAHDKFKHSQPCCFTTRFLSSAPSSSLENINTCVWASVLSQDSWSCLLPACIESPLHQSTWRLCLLSPCGGGIKIRRFIFLPCPAIESSSPFFPRLS